MLLASTAASIGAALSAVQAAMATPQLVRGPLEGLRAALEPLRFCGHILEEGQWTAMGGESGVTLADAQTSYTVTWEGPTFLAHLPGDCMWRIAWTADGTSVRMLQGSESVGNLLLEPDGTVSDFQDSHAMAEQLRPRFEERIGELSSSHSGEDGGLADGGPAGPGNIPDVVGDWKTIAARAAAIAAVAVPAIAKIVKEQQQQEKPADPVTGSSCKKCNAALRPGVKFCVKCGELIVTERKCAACGILLEPDDVFCGGCGAKTV